MTSDVRSPLLDPILHNGGTLPRIVSACVLAEGAATEDKRQRYIKTQRRLVLALIVACVFMVVEVVGGIMAHSLAIITDAAHLLSDVSGFAVSIAAAYAASTASRSHFSYGYHRLEVLGALASVASVWLVTGILLWEAVQRVQNPQPVDGKLMFILAQIGVGVNVLMIWILGGHHSHGGHSHAHSHGESDAHDHDHSHSGGGGGGTTALAAIEEGAAAGHAHSSGGGIDPGAHHDHGSHRHGGEAEGENINIRGAAIHVLGDLVQSLGVAAAGAVIWAHPGDARWALADPVCTFLFGAVVIWTTVGILKEIGEVLMERMPRGLSADAVAQSMRQIEGVCDIHDLHCWSLTPGIPLLAAHVSLLPGADAAEVLRRVTAYCRGLGITHSTIQIVTDAGACPCGTNDGDRDTLT